MLPALLYPRHLFCLAYNIFRAHASGSPVGIGQFRRLDPGKLLLSLGVKDEHCGLWESISVTADFCHGVFSANGDIEGLDQPAVDIRKDLERQSQFFLKAFIDLGWVSRDSDKLNGLFR